MRVGDGGGNDGKWGGNWKKSKVGEMTGNRWEMRVGMVGE